MTHRTACDLAAVPGMDGNGPSGALIGAEDYMEYTHGTMHQPSHQTIVCALPRRSIGYNDYKNCMHKQTKSKFLDLAQNELGDV